jgi:hypothetical protein
VKEGNCRDARYDDALIKISISLKLSYLFEHISLRLMRVYLDFALFLCVTRTPVSFIILLI